jgi:hypothetical protein
MKLPPVLFGVFKRLLMPRNIKGRENPIAAELRTTQVFIFSLK